MDFRIVCLVFTIIYIGYFLSRKLFWGKYFVIKITTSKAICIKGNPPKEFLNDCSIIAMKYRDVGYIYAVKSNSGLKLEFTKGITESSAQRLRNVFPFEIYQRKHNDPSNKRRSR